MKEFLVCLAALILFSGAGVVLLQMPAQTWKTRTGQAIALLVSLGVAFEVCRIGINYWQDQQSSTRHARERKEDKKFQDLTTDTTETILGKSNEIIGYVRPLNDSPSPELVARYPRGYILVGDADEPAIYRAKRKPTEPVQDVNINLERLHFEVVDGYATVSFSLNDSQSGGTTFQGSGNTMSLELPFVDGSTVRMPGLQEGL